MNGLKAVPFKEFSFSAASSVRGNGFYERCWYPLSPEATGHLW